MNEALGLAFSGRRVDARLHRRAAGYAGDPSQQCPGRAALQQQVCPGWLCPLPVHFRFGHARSEWVQIHEEPRQEPAAFGQILPGSRRCSAARDRAELLPWGVRADGHREPPGQANPILGHGFGTSMGWI